MQDLNDYVKGIARAAKKASVSLRSVTAESKNRALMAMAREIDQRRAEIRAANARDVERGRKSGLAAAFLDRLTLTDRRIDEMISSVKEIAGFEDPVGEVIGVRRPSGFLLEKVRTPIGVVAIIYESRPNVTVDAAALCLKSGMPQSCGAAARPSTPAACSSRPSARASGPPGWTATPCNTWRGRSTKPSTFLSRRPGSWTW